MIIIIVIIIRIFKPPKIYIFLKYSKVKEKVNDIYDNNNNNNNDNNNHNHNNGAAHEILTYHMSNDVDNIIDESNHNNNTHTDVVNVVNSTSNPSLQISATTITTYDQDIDFHDVSKWTNKDVCNWLKFCLLKDNNVSSSLVDRVLLKFDAQYVDGQVLLVLDQDLLQEIGISKADIIKKILILANELKQQNQETK